LRARACARKPERGRADALLAGQFSGVTRGASNDQGGPGVACERPAEQEALHRVDVFGAKMVQPGGRLDALGERSETEVTAMRSEQADQGFGLG